MDRSREDTCGCGDKGVSSPSLRLLIEMVERAEAEKKEREERENRSA
jgi:hypothetical protein